MQVDYQIGLDDIGAFSLHHARTSKLSRRRLRSTQILGIFSLVVLVMVWPGWDNVDRIVFFIVMALFWLVGYPFYYRWAIKRNIRKIYSQTESRNVIGEHTIAIEPEYVIEKSPIGESRTAWSGIEKIQSDGQYIYVYVGPLYAFVIPKRAFKTGEDAEAFLQQAQAYRLACR
jgi:hypothetical protein